MTARDEYKITNVINQIADEINTILDENQKDRYFDGMVLLYSFLENLLKWLVYVKVIWSKCDRELDEKEIHALKQFCNQQDFYAIQNLALIVGLIDLKLFQKIDAVRQERNNIIHQFWLHKHRGNLLVLRKKLEKLAGVANSLVGIFNDLVEETGSDETYDIFLVRPKKQILI